MTSDLANHVIVPVDRFLELGDACFFGIALVALLFQSPNACVSRLGLLSLRERGLLLGEELRRRCGVARVALDVARR